MTQYRVEIDIDWFGGLRDRLARLRRLPIDTLKSWLTLALLAAILALLALQALRGPTPAPSPPTPNPGPPVPGKVDPGPAPEVKPTPTPAPAPEPQPQPEAPASPLAKAAKDYLQTFPGSLREFEQQLRARKFKTKAEAVKFSKTHAAALATELDNAFSAGVDQAGNITKPDAIADKIGEAATALGAP